MLHCLPRALTASSCSDVQLLPLLIGIYNVPLLPYRGRSCLRFPLIGNLLLLAGQAGNFIHKTRAVAIGLALISDRV